MIIRLENDVLRVTLNTLGGAIESMVDKRSGMDHCWRYDAAYWPRRTSICFPICSLLRGGAYTHRGQTYEMPMHGFLRECDFALLSQTDTHAVMCYTSTPDTRSVYPFDFRFELDQHLEGSTLVVEYRVSNPGSEPLYFSVGSHYAYALPAEQKDCLYRFTRPQHAAGLVLANGAVQGKGQDLLCGKTELSMDGLFDKSSQIFETADLDTDSIAIATAGGDFTRVSYTGFPYTVLWAPKGGSSPFACIEAWAGMADYEGRSSEISEKEGIQTALPGETRTFVQRITAL